MTIFLLKFVLFSKPFQKVLACETLKVQADSGSANNIVNIDLTDGVELEILGELFQPLDLAVRIRQCRCRRPSTRRVSDAAPGQGRLRLGCRVPDGVAARLEHVFAVFGILEMDGAT